MNNEIKQWNPAYLSILYMAGRNCYGLEKFSDYTLNTKKKFVKKLIESKHESVLEHVSISVFITGCSRSFMAQLTRHRLAAYSIKSQHYCEHSNFLYKSLEAPGMEEEYKILMQQINTFYKDAIAAKIPHYIAREVLPNACLTNIFMTANVREWRHIIKLRIQTNNTPEIQVWAVDVLKEFYELMPELFEDLVNEYVRLH